MMRVPGLTVIGPVFWMPGMVGVRVRGWQLDIRDHRKARPNFSERYGYESCGHHVGPLCFKRSRLRGLA